MSSWGRLPFWLSHAEWQLCFVSTKSTLNGSHPLPFTSWPCVMIKIHGTNLWYKGASPRWQHCHGEQHYPDNANGIVTTLVNTHGVDIPPVSSPAPDLELTHLESAKPKMCHSAYSIYYLLYRTPPGLHPAGEGVSRMIFYYHPNIIATHCCNNSTVHWAECIWTTVGAWYYIVANLILDKQPNFTVNLYHLSLLDLL